MAYSVKYIIAVLNTYAVLVRVEGKGVVNPFIAD
jgi:hypothetical protein